MVQRKKKREEINKVRHLTKRGHDMARLRLSPSLVIFSQSSSCMVVRHLEYQIDWILYLVIVFVVFVGVRLQNRHLTHCRLERWLECGCDDMRDED